MLISIDMVYYLARFKFSPEFFLGYISMFVHSMEFWICVRLACSLICSFPLSNDNSFFLAPAFAFIHRIAGKVEVSHPLTCK